MGSNAIAQCSQVLDCQLDDIAGLEPAANGLGRELENAAGTDRTRAQDIARPENGVTAGVSQKLGPGPVHRAGIAARQHLAVHCGGHLQVQPPPAIAAGQLVQAHKLGAERGCEVFTLAWA